MGPDVPSGRRIRLRKSRFTDEQIVAIVREAEGGVIGVVRGYAAGRPSRPALASPTGTHPAAVGACPREPARAADRSRPPWKAVRSESPERGAVPHYRTDSRTDSGAHTPDTPEAER